MIKSIPARPAHPVDAPPIHPFMDERDMAWLDATGAIRAESWLTAAFGERPPLPVGHGLSL
jgi:hypothetical protein